MHGRVVRYDDQFSGRADGEAAYGPVSRGRHAHLHARSGTVAEEHGRCCRRRRAAALRWRILTCHGEHLCVPERGVLKSPERGVPARGERGGRPNKVQRRGGGEERVDVRGDEESSEAYAQPA